MTNVHILCSNCPSPAPTQAGSLFRHSNDVDDALIHAAYPVRPQCILIARGRP